MKGHATMVSSASKSWDLVRGQRQRRFAPSLNGLIAIGAKSATVVGPEGWLCDAMATAVMVAGQDSAKWFGQPELAGYQVFAVTRHEQSAWSI
jgi:thiamine biosynthesis lipoprotein ApbE